MKQVAATQTEVARNIVMLTNMMSGFYTSVANWELAMSWRECRWSVCGYVSEILEISSDLAIVTVVAGGLA